MQQTELAPPAHLAVVALVELRAEAASNLETAQRRLWWSTALLEKTLRNAISAQGIAVPPDAPISAQMDDDGKVLPLVSWGVTDG